MPSGYSTSLRSFTVPTPARACWAKGSDRRGGQVGESRSLASGWIPWVLVDNKSVAEIGDRHLVRRGSTSLRRGENAAHQHESASHHRDRREAGTCGKGARAAWSFTNTLMTRSHPDRKAGINPIEGVLGREVVGFNRRAAERLWLARHARCSLGSVGRSIGRWKPRGCIAERQRAPDTVREGQAPPAERRRGSATRRKSVATNPATGEAFAAKNRVMQSAQGGANRRHRR
jgi:hypothetical protein